MFFSKSGWGAEIPIGQFLFRFYAYDSLAQEGCEKNFIIHDHCGYELQMIHGGSFTLLMNDREYQLKTGQVCIITPRSYHAFLSCDPLEDSRRYSLRFTVDKLEASEPATAIDFSSLLRSSVVCTPSPVVFSLAQQLEQELCRREIWCQDSIRSLITCIIIYISQAIATQNPVQLPIYSQDDTLQMENVLRMNSMECFFSRHYQQSVSLQDLSDTLGLSPRQTANLIQAFYGCSFTRHILKIRLENAKAMLRYSDEPLETVALGTGFQTLNYFYSTFKKEIGTTPSRYRHQFRSVSAP